MAEAAERPEFQAVRTEWVRVSPKWGGFNLSRTSEKTKGVAFEALEAKVRYPSIVPRYKEKVEDNLTLVLKIETRTSNLFQIPERLCASPLLSMTCLAFWNAPKVPDRCETS